MLTFQRHKLMRRRGISLTEVLLSMFVMTVGVLGLAALIPVGGSDVATAVRADRTSNLGRAAFRDVQVRDWLEPDMWMPAVPPNPTTAPLWEDPRSAAPLNLPTEFANSFCIDPLFVSRNNPTYVNTADSRLREFPYSLDNDAQDDGDGDWTTLPQPPRMLRGTLHAWPAFTAPPIQLAHADRLFRSTDDLVFGLPDGEPDGRPFASLGSAQQTRQFTGDYSWLFTVSPLLNGHNALTQLINGAPHTYTVSAVVFQKRTVELAPLAIATRAGTPPTERTVYADFISGVGLGGGDVRLGLPVTPGVNNDPNLPKSSDFPQVKAGQWIMLSGWLVPPSGEPISVFRWYRVVTAGPLLHEPSAPSGPTRTTPEWAQYVTLAGPDWWSSSPNEYIDVDHDGTDGGPFPTAYAAIIDGVVGVYEKTMRLDTRSFGVR